MKSTSAAAIGGIAVVVLSGVAAWVGARLSMAPPSPASPAASLPGDLRDRFDEIERKQEYLDRRVDGIERTLGDLLAKIEGHGDGAPAAGPGGPRRALPPEEGSATPSGEQRPAAPVREKTEDEIRAERVAQLEGLWQKAADSVAPARLAEMADERPGAADTRRNMARLEARSVAVAVGARDKIDDLERIFIEHAERLARDVGPLVREGAEKADGAALQSKLDEVWKDLDRQVKEIVSADAWPKFESYASAHRGLLRQYISAKSQKR